MAKARPESACRASLTLPKFPSPSVRPISYFPIRIASSDAAMGGKGPEPLGPGTGAGASPRNGKVQGELDRERAWWTS